MRTVFMGTPEIAVPALQLLARKTSVQCVVTQPDRPAGRGHQLQPPAIKIAAQQLQLPIWQPETLKGQASAPQLAGAELFVVMAYGELLREDVLRLPSGGCINLHASLLPRWRGASPLQAAIRAGDSETGVTVMKMVRALDAGAMYVQEKIALTATTTLPQLHDEMAEKAALALDKYLSVYPNMVGVEQNPALVTHCRKLTSDDGHLQFTATMDELDRWVRAYTPAPGCWVQVHTERWRIHAVEKKPLIQDIPPGAVTQRDGAILVGCADGALVITRLQAPGKKALDARDFLNGNQLPPTFS
jgi:methionyl-tRNA formyltransferase